MTLQRYRAKRNFKATPEPRGRVATKKSSALAFVIQKHAARNLHYDFRLELDGVLLSWAVPKGPSLDPADKRLAMHVEDHPIDYGDFEGTIPAKQYGAGTVLLWDRGVWTPKDDPEAAYRKGRLKFDLAGTKLRGGWNLVRTHGGKFGGNGKEAWLLIKENDDFARRGVDAHIVDAQPESVVSGRTLAEIASDKEHVWHSNRSVAENVKGVALAPPRPPANGRRDASLSPPQPASPRKAKLPKLATVTKSSTGKPALTVRGITISHPDKILYPEAKLTKRDLAEYYEKVGSWIVPHLAGRPLSLVRCPDGWEGQCFYQKHAAKGVNAEVTRVEVPEGKATATYMAADSAAAVVALLQWGVTELHPWGARVPKLDRPDRLIFDFDPDDGLPWAEVASAAGLMQTLLTELTLTSFLKTTGGKGLHVVIPIRPTLDWVAAKAFTKSVADFLVRTFPDRFIATLSKAQRKGKIFIDYLRNAEGATAIAPYSVRARSNAPVAMPIAWEELDKDVRFDWFNVKNVPARLARLKSDPWAQFLEVRQSITRTMIKRVS